MGSGQYWHVPIAVAKGARPGKRVLLVAGVHGDELNPIGALQGILARLDSADIGVGMHTGGNGIDFALFVFASPDAESQRIAELFPVDQIVTSPSFSGTLEHGLNAAGIPAVTLEIGCPRGFDPKMIEAGVLGAENLLSHYGMSGKPLGQTAKERNVYRGNDPHDMFADASGFVTLLVGLNDEVRKGQKVAVQRNAFGDVVHEYVSTVDGAGSDHRHGCGAGAGGRCGQPDRQQPGVPAAAMRS